MIIRSNVFFSIHYYYYRRQKFFIIYNTRDIFAALSSNFINGWLIFEYCFFVWYSLVNISIFLLQLSKRDICYGYL